MFRRSTFKNFLYCLLLSSIVSTAICAMAKFNFSLSLVVFGLISNSINVLLVICLFKHQFIEENIERENYLKRQIEYSSSHLTSIINNLPLIAFIIDTDYKFITGNIEALKFFDITTEEQFRKLSIDVFERDTMELIKEENELIIQTKKTFVADKQLKLKSGRQQWYRVRKVPILDKKDNVNGFVVFGRNIDEERAAQKQRETYISTLSHDLKIPTLAQIRALELIVNEKLGKINDGQREILNLTLDSCHCMYDMLSTILSTYKYENNDITLNYEKIHMLKLIDDCFVKSYRDMRHKNIQIKVLAKDKFVSLYADRIQMRKAFENLINHCVSNAYENTEIVCEISKHNDKNNIFVSLGFESPYVSSESIQNMFKMYTTSAEKMDKVGSSLNLYLAKQIITAHNGKINVESKQSNYNNYNIELPCINECKIPAFTY